MGKKKKKTDSVQQRLTLLEEEYGELLHHVVMDPSDVTLLQNAVALRNAARVFYEQHTKHVDRLTNMIAAQYDNAGHAESPVISMGTAEEIGVLVWPAPPEEPEEDKAVA